MKKGEQAELSAKWWRGSQPAGLASAGRFETALKHYEAARAKLQSSGSHDALDDAMEALDDAATAADAVATEAGKARGSAEMDATAHALHRLDLRKEREWAAAQVKQDEDEEGDDDAGGLADPSQYQAYLLKALKKLKNGPMNFGLVLGSKATDHRLVLHRKRAAKTLAMKMVKDLGLRHFSFGVATPSEEKAQTILLNVQGHLLPGMRKKSERMLKELKPLPFMRVALFVSGKEVDDPDDDEAGDDESEDSDAGDADTGADDTGADDAGADDAGADDAGAEEAAAIAGQSQSAPVRLKQQMEAIEPSIKSVLQRHVDLREPIMATVAAFVASINQGDVASAQRQMGRIKAIIAPHVRK